MTYPPLPEDDEDLPAAAEVRVPVERVAVRLPSGTPYVTYAIMGVTIFIYLLQFGANWLMGYDLPLYLGAKVNELIQEGQLWRFFTPALLHGSLLHIGVNMYSLNILGPQLEPFYGHGRFLLLYLVAVFSGVVASFAFSQYPSVGASTAIFGLLGALGMFAYLNRGLFGARAQSLLANIIQVAVINLIIGLSPGIDNWGHVGGLAGGALLAWLGGPHYRLAGDPPEMRLEDQRSGSLFAASALGVFLLFSAIAGFILIVR